MTVTTRIEDPVEDRAFVRRLVLDTLTVELGAAEWPQPMRDHLLELQYAGRRNSAQTAHPDGHSRIILLDGAPAGWIYWVDLGDHVRVSEIMVAPEQRGRGAGTGALREVMAAAGDRPVRLNVNVFNLAAIRLYERLGFRRIDGNEVQHVMEQRPVTA